MGKGAKEAAKEATIGGIPASKLNEQSIDDAIKRLKLEVKGTGPTTPLLKKVGALLAYFETRSDAEKGPCDHCGAESTLDLPCCPFCGTGDNPPEAIAEHVVDAAFERMEDGDSSDSGEAEEPDETPAEPADATFDDLKPSTSLAPEVPEGVLEYPKPAPDLDKLVQEIRELQRGTAAGAWLLAKKVTEVGKSQIWKQRRDDAGKPAYRTFEQFLEKELDIGRKYGTELLKLYGRFSEEEFQKVGPTKLRLVLQAPQEQQAEVLEKLKGGAPRKEVTEEVRQARAEKGLKTSQGKTPKKNAPTPERKTITVAQIEGRKTIPLYKKPEGRITIDDAQRAKKLADVPFGYLDLTNDVRMWITVLPHPITGELTARVEFKRLEASK